jgi:hypothetical protein
MGKMHAGQPQMSYHAVSDKKSDAKGPRRDLRKAWIAVALIPVAFVVAMVLGEVVIGALGYPAGEETPPVGLRAAVGIPATLLLVAPGVIAGIYGLRARRAGEPRGLLPGVIGIAVAGLFVLQSILGFIGSFVGPGP